MTDHAQQLLSLAADYLASARANLASEPPRLAVAFSEARHAAELAGKAALQRKTGTYPRKHEIGGLLHREGLVPASLDPRRVDRALRAFTRGEYGIVDDPARDEVLELLAIAEALIKNVRDAPR